MRTHENGKVLIIKLHHTFEYSFIDSLFIYLFIYRWGCVGGGGGVGGSNDVIHCWFTADKNIIYMVG